MTKTADLNCRLTFEKVKKPNVPTEGRISKYHYIVDQLKTLSAEDALKIPSTGDVKTDRGIATSIITAARKAKLKIRHSLSVDPKYIYLFK